MIPPGSIISLPFVFSFLFAWQGVPATRPPLTQRIMSPEAAAGNLRVIEGQQVYVIDEIVKSDQDTCNYRHLTLPNGLKALIVSEPDLDKVRHTNPTTFTLV